VVFIDSTGRLNFAFNYINAKRLPSETSAIYASYAEVDPTKITASDTPLSASAPYLAMRQLETGEPAPMWVVADLGKIKESSSVRPVPVSEATAEMPPAATQQTDAAVTPTEKTVPTATPEVMLKQEIKNKLKYLKELLDEGLITEKDYESKKQELLDKID